MEEFGRLAWVGGRCRVMTAELFLPDPHAPLLISSTYLAIFPNALSLSIVGGEVTVLIRLVNPLLRSANSCPLWLLFPKTHSEPFPHGLILKG